MAAEQDQTSEEHGEPVIRDKRRIDPETGEPRPVAEPDAEAEEPLTLQDFLDAAGEQAPAEPAADAASADAALAAERLADLQRLSAEYANYRKRVDRERETLREYAVADVLQALLPVADDLDRAEAHGDLGDGPLAVIAQKLRAVLEGYGLSAYGAAGEAFDPQLHEAIAQLPAPDAEPGAIIDVVQRGWRSGDRVLRAAKVAVAAAAE